MFWDRLITVMLSTLTRLVTRSFPSALCHQRQCIFLFMQVRLRIIQGTHLPFMVMARDSVVMQSNSRSRVSYKTQKPCLLRLLFVVMPTSTSQNTIEQICSTWPCTSTVTFKSDRLSHVTVQLNPKITGQQVIQGPLTVSHDLSKERMFDCELDGQRVDRLFLAQNHLSVFLQSNHHSPTNHKVVVCRHAQVDQPKYKFSTTNLISDTLPSAHMSVISHFLKFLAYSGISLSQTRETYPAQLIVDLCTGQFHRSIRIRGLLPVKTVTLSL